MKRDKLFVKITDVFEKRDSAFPELFFKLFFFGGVFQKMKSYRHMIIFGKFFYLVSSGVEQV